MASTDVMFPAAVSASVRFAAEPCRDRLLMVFLGWGMSPEPFISLSKPGYDVMLLWDYRGADGGFAERLRETLSRYSEIVVVAWSFGVVAASYVLDSLDGLAVTRKIAVNGTPRHIDRTCGIPPAVFSLTLRGLSPAAVEKFNGRMFVGDRMRDAFLSEPSSRGFESVLEELRVFGALPPYEGAVRWDFAIIGGKDLIFPPDNQAACWAESSCKVAEIPSAGHYIDLQSVMDDYVVDKELVASRFGSARGTYRGSAGAQREVAERLWELAAPLIPRRPERVVEVGVGDGLLTELYVPALEPAALSLWDIADVDSSRFPAGSRFVRCDAEIDVAGLGASSVDLILSASTLQWFHSPETFVAKAFVALKPGGIMALSFFGEGTYREVAAITGVSLRYPDPSRWHIDGEVLVMEKDTLAVSFDDAAAAVRHISRTGVNALRRDPSTSVGAGRRLLRELPKEADGRVTLTYVPCYLIIRKPITQ